MVFAAGAILRLIYLGHRPGLYFDEVLYGLDSYSVLKTGRDVYGHLLPLAFQSSGYYPPLYPYLLAPFLAVFGLWPWVVRLPAALAGISTLVLIYLLGQELSPKSKLFAITSLFILAFLPWHIHLTRIAFLAGFGIPFLLGGVYLFLKGAKNSFYYFLGTLAMAASLEAHYGYKLLAPLIFAGLVILNFKKMRQNKAILALMAVIWLVTIGILAVSYSKYNTNFRVTELINTNPISITQEYLKAFSPNFLFIRGDVNRLTNPFGAGQLPWVMLPFILIGLIGYLKQTNTTKFIIASFLLITPVPSALAGLGEHAVRNSPMIIAFVFLAALGVEFLINIKKWPRIILLVIALGAFILVWQTIFRMQYLFGEYSAQYGNLWGNTQRQAINFAENSKVENKVFIDSYNVMLSYFAFEKQVAPNEVQTTTLHPTEFGSIPAKKIDGAYFLSGEQGLGKDYLSKFPANTLVVDTLFFEKYPNLKIFQSSDGLRFGFLQIE